MSAWPRYGMSEHRYADLCRDQDAELTSEEIDDGWHWCPEYDSLLMNVNDHDSGCSCNDPRAFVNNFNMQAPTQEQIDKLPKWASGYITTLIRERDDAAEALKQFDKDQSESRIYTEDWFFVKGERADTRFYIQSNKVVFTLPSGELSCRLDEHRLNVCCQSSRGQIVVVPNCSNVLDLMIVQDRVLRSSDT